MAHGLETMKRMNKEATAKADTLKTLAQDIVDNNWRYGDAYNETEALLIYILGEKNV